MIFYWRNATKDEDRSVTSVNSKSAPLERGWLIGRGLDSGARGLEFETCLRCDVSLSKTLYSLKVLVIPSKQWLHPDMTEKLLSGTLNLNTNKQISRKSNLTWAYTVFSGLCLTTYGNTVILSYVGELRKSLHSIMLDLLDEKWNKEAVDAMNEMEDFVRCVLKNIIL